MQDLSWALLCKLAPEHMTEIGRRAMLLEHIENREPVGRRAAAQTLGLSEREVRAAADALKDQGLISYSASGMTLTRPGRSLIPEVRMLCRMVTDLGEMERELAQKLDLDRVMVVSGDADENPAVLRDVGRAAAHRLRQIVRPDMVIAIAGGSTMAEVARAMVPSASGIMVVPARGGMGSSASTQADAVAGDLAAHMNAQCRLIHLPDGLNLSAMQEMLKMPAILETVELMRNADIVLFGVGRADAMARRRGMENAQVETLLHLGAVGEALGNFFDIEGRTVYQSPSVSTELQKRHPGSRMMAVAAGTGKGQAILAAVRHQPPNSLILDEGAARSILKLLQ